MDLTDRDVVVVGTGASAIQFVPPVAEVARSVTVLQRSAPWVVREPDRATGRSNAARSPPCPAGIAPTAPTCTGAWRAAGRRSAATPWPAGSPRGWRCATCGAASQTPRCGSHPTTPSAASGCCSPNDWYPALQRSNVEVLDGGAARLQEVLARTVPVRRHTDVRRGRVADVPVEVVRRAGTVDHHLLLYLHGGGFVVGSPRTHRAVTAALAHETGATVVVPDYRLAPEHPFPAPCDDVRAVYEVLTARDPSRLTVAGDSAGGNLALGLALETAADGRRPPDAVGVISPLVDLAMPHGSLDTADDAMLRRQPDPSYVDLYLGADGDPSDPRCSPHLGDLSRLPPTLVAGRRRRSPPRRHHDADRGRDRRRGVGARAGVAGHVARPPGAARAAAGRRSHTRRPRCVLVAGALP